MKHENDDSVEVITAMDAKLQCEEWYSPDGMLMFRSVNGVDVTPPGEIIGSSSSVSFVRQASRKEMEDFYGKTYKKKI